MMEGKKPLAREKSWFWKVMRRFHPQGIPWPGSVLYNALSGSSIFLRHYQMVAEDIGHYGRSGRVLDIGTGPARLPLAICRTHPDMRVVGVDISSAMVARARKNVEQAGGPAAIEITEAGAASLPFPDDSFDLVVSTGAIHHWKEPAAAMNEVYRVLKPGHYALLYDLVQKLPPAVAEQAKREFGRVRFTLLWLHSFEEPFYDVQEFQSLATGSKFQAGDVRFVGVLCCLVLKKE
jgi:ubiquinone/menaquinone biosynthesis C-methylase UbiE